MGKKVTSYNEAVRVFNERGLCIDIDDVHFDRMSLKEEKIKCHCIHHPNTPLEYYFSVVKSGRFGCKECRKEKNIKRKNMTPQEKMDIISNTGYTYVSGDTSRILNPLNLICPEGHECRGSINDLLRADCVCNICNGKLPPNYWDIYKCQSWLDSSEIFKGYKILDFDNGRAYIKCPVDAHKPYWTSWQHIYSSNTICRDCYYDNNNRKNWTLDRAKELLHEHGFTMVDESKYISSHKRVPCYDKYGFIYMVSIHYILRGRTKFALWKGNPYAVHNIKLYCELFRPEYEFISDDYYGTKKEHRWRYNGDCIDEGIYNREFDLNFGYFVNARCGHPALSKSKLESKCESILKKYKINFESQKRFDDCRDVLPLPFDFYCVLNNQKVCIETDGGQHMYPVEKFGGLEGLLKRQQHDQIKNEYCKINNIKLIRIPESKFKHMEEILVQELYLSTQE